MSVSDPSDALAHRPDGETRRRPRESAPMLTLILFIVYSHSQSLPVPSVIICTVLVRYVYIIVLDYIQYSS